MQRLGTVQPLFDQLYIVLRRFSAALRVLLKDVQHIDRGRKAYGVDGPVSATHIVFEQFKDARPTKDAQRLADRGVSPIWTAYKATPKLRRTSFGSARMSRRLDAIQLSFSAVPGPQSNYIYFCIDRKSRQRTPR